ncbi:MAG: hypothetical protein HZB16_10285 [Armatimonadetes bacterium]|nr:hypothetical protein [Armatimonadota bacterium]
MTVFTCPERTPPLTPLLLGQLAPALDQATGAAWWAWIDVWATVWPSALAPRVGAGPCPVNTAIDWSLDGPLWTPAAEAIAMAGEFHQMIDGLLALCSAPSAEPICCLALIEAFDSSQWRVFTSQPEVAQAVLGDAAAVQVCQFNACLPVGIADAWVADILGPDRLILRAR